MPMAPTLIINPENKIGLKPSSFHVVLISTYELGRQPFGLASPAAWLTQNGFTVTSLDLAVTTFPREAVEQADLIALYVPMHTATRLAIQYVPSLKQINPSVPLCFYGLYAPLNENYLRQLGGQFILGGEFETGLLHLCQRLRTAKAEKKLTEQVEPITSLARQTFLIPNRQQLPPLMDYVQLFEGDFPPKTTGYVEASRGCKHQCRHCPIVPVYQGKFRIVQEDVVLADIRQQVAMGAQHITFGDPDFFNGLGHAIPLVKALHREFPELTYDVTIKVEHLVKHVQVLPVLKETGCLIVTTAVESFDEQELIRLKKHHTFEEFTQVVQKFQQIGLTLNPTFMPFTPWTSLTKYREFLASLLKLNLIENVASIQLAIRLLITENSALLELSEIQALIGPFNQTALAYDWHHPDPLVDELYNDVLALVSQGTKAKTSRFDIFRAVWERAFQDKHETPLPPFDIPSRATIPFLNEPWYC